MSVGGAEDGPPHGRGRGVHPQPDATATARRSRSTPPGASARRVVSGEVTPDNFLVDKVLCEIVPPHHLRQGDRVPAGRRRRASTRSRRRAPSARPRRRASPTTRSTRSPGWPGGPRSTTAARRTSSGRSTPTCPTARTSSCSRPARRRCGAGSRSRQSAAERRPDAVDRRHPRLAARTHGTAGSRPSPTTADHRRKGQDHGGPVPEPVRDRDPRGRRGLAGAVHLLAARSARTGATTRTSMFWFHDGVHWPEALTPVGRHLRRVRPGLAVAVQHPPLPDPAGRTASTSGSSTATPYLVPGDDRRPRPRSRPGCRTSWSGPASTSRNWDDLYDALDGQDPRRSIARDGARSSFEPLPDDGGPGRHHRRAGAWARGTSSSASYHRLLDLALQLWQYHFEFLNLGYAAYLDFFGFCKQAFPGIPDLAIAKMVAGVDVDLFRPDEELKKLARLAVDARRRRRASTSTSAAEVIEALRGSDAGQAVAGRSGTASAEPWFNFSTGTGFYHYRQGVDRAPGDPVRVHRATTSPSCARGSTSTGPIDGHPGRARPDRRRVRRAAGHRRGPGRLRAEARPGPDGVPLRREPQLLRRALEPLGALAQDARARRVSWPRRASSAPRTTSSCSSGTRSPRPCGTTTAAGRSGRQPRGPVYWPAGSSSAAGAS